MNRFGKDGIKAFACALAGILFGAILYAKIGGIGVVAMGTGFGVTMGPLMCIGAGAGLIAYGFYWWGRNSGGDKSGAPVRRPA